MLLKYFSSILKQVTIKYFPLFCRRKMSYPGHPCQQVSERWINVTKYYPGKLCGKVLGIYNN